MSKVHIDDFTKGFIIGAFCQGAKGSEIYDLVQKYNMKAGKTAIYDMINEFK